VFCEVRVKVQALAKFTSQLICQGDLHKLAILTDSAMKGICLSMMQSNEHRRLVAAMPAVLNRIFAPFNQKARVLESGQAGWVQGADLTFEFGSRFVVEFRKSATSAPILCAAEKVRAMAGRLDGIVPLVAVPYMGEVGRKICLERGVGWFDLSGNAFIVAPGLQVVIEGKRDAFVSSGRPTNLFAPRSSRIVRMLLANPLEQFSQARISELTGLDRGFVSRLLSRLVAEELVSRLNDGMVRVNDRGLLLDAWRDSYNFDRHHCIRGSLPARSGEALLHQVASSLTGEGLEYAATGLGAAWLMTGFAAFRTVTIFVREEIPSEFLERIGFIPESRGANLWLVVPDDDGVFQWTRPKDGVICAHPAQVFVDLKGHHERSADAAAMLRRQILDWNKDDR